MKKGGILMLIGFMASLVTTMAMADLATKHAVLQDCYKLRAEGKIDRETFEAVTRLDSSCFIRNASGQIRFAPIQEGLALWRVSNPKRIVALAAGLEDIPFKPGKVEYPKVVYGTFAPRVFAPIPFGYPRPKWGFGFTKIPPAKLRSAGVFKFDAVPGVTQ